MKQEKAEQTKKERGFVGRVLFVFASWWFDLFLSFLALSC